MYSVITSDSLIRLNSTVNKSATRQLQCTAERSCYLTPSTSASHIEGAAGGGDVTLYTAGVVLSSNDHKDHAAREQSSY